MSHLFTIGPVEMFPETLEIGSKQVPYFRNDEFSQVVHSVSAGLNRLLFNENGEVILLACSGTGAMEATVINCFTKDDNLIVIDGGSFGHRFVQICDIYDIPHTVIKLDDDEVLTREMIDEVIEDGKFTGLIVNLDETSNGKLYDVKMLADVCNEHDLLFVVDAISSFLADEVNMDKYGIDAVILSSQKALSLAPGLSIVSLSEKMLDRVKTIDSKSVYFDFKDYLKNGERGQTPFTPAVRVIVELDDMIKRLESKGIENIIKETSERASYFRSKIREIGLDYPNYPLSNAVTPVIFHDENADVVYRELIDKYGLTVNPNGGDHAKTMFRVSHIGKHSKEDMDNLIRAIDEIINSHNKEVQLSKMTKIQKNLYQLLIEFDEICKRYDIKYLLAAGASLGAVRNHRFMPWDDDIDLYISRDNWNKLRHILETQENVLPEGRSFVYNENTPYYCNPIPRYVNNETTTIYISQSLPGKACGQHLELFIFDPMPLGEKAKEEYLDLLHVYTELMSPYFVVNKNASLEEWKKHYELYEHYCKRVDEEGEEKVLKELEEKLQQYSPENCDQYCMRWGIKNYIYDKEHFELESERVQFEGGEFPIGYYPEGILRVAYGDSWMYIPEYEEQIVHGGLKNDSVPFEEYTNRYLPKINRESVFKKYKINKRNNASVFYQRRQIDRLVAKEKVAIDSKYVIRDLDGKDDFLRSLLEDGDYERLSDEFESFVKLQNIGEVLKYNVQVPISDKNLATFLFSLIEQGRYYDVSKFLKVREMQDEPLNDEFNQIKDMIEICREISIARYDKKDVKLVQSLIDKYDTKYDNLLDICRAKLWVMENTAKSMEDYKKIDELCGHVLSSYPFDGETMAFQARAKLECGNEKDAMKLYKESINYTRNGIIWQKVEDESGISRIEIEADLIDMLN